MSDESATRRAIHVVAGLLIDGDLICITRRHDSTHQGGKWEFPGGKLEANEGPLAGLQRELREELGIQVRGAIPFLCVHHDYGDMEVTLDVWRVAQYEGTPRGREAQPLRWVRLAELDPSDFPDADRPVIRRLQLPTLYLLSDVGRFGTAEFSRRLARALEAGTRLVQLREPQMNRTEFVTYAHQLAALCHDFGARLLINADPDTVAECDADGVHLNSRRLMELSRRPLSQANWVAASCHNEQELQKAQQLDVDFVVLGPVLPTASHPNAPTMGWERFCALCGSTTLPVYAIGGTQPEHILKAWHGGARGLAMIRGIWDRDDFEDAVRRLARSPRFVAEDQIGRV